MLLCMGCLARWPAGAACSRWPDRPAAPRLALGWQHAGLQCLGPQAQQLVPPCASACLLAGAGRPRAPRAAGRHRGSCTGRGWLPPPVSHAPLRKRVAARRAAGPRTAVPKISCAQTEEERRGRQERNPKLQIKNTPSILNESK
ncbi:hypothetical protein GQ55_2G441300 [Panicum hallii var. hallii]|uniref:Uncharacterized protein n=1 Tax=Panicum hallii var. hallii TaxID=1504633 RepID=A0A2T7EYV5_9POAL|nr:hypothetical protein GQ55_2G441300 [Panicum hallii var. hallii]